MTDLTVVVSSYKYGHLAAHCLESLQSQTVQPDRILFVDDGVGDCLPLTKIYPNIEWVFREKNLGVVSNFQDMLMRVETKKVMFLGADNWLRSDAIELLTQPDTDIVCYDIIVTGPRRYYIHNIYKDGTTPYQGDFYWKRKGGHHGSMVYNVEMAKSVGGYRGTNTIGSNEDQNLWHDLMNKGATVHHIDEGLLYYRRHHENYNP
jgi:glycosyltransferase involved in cell wall biosynthesis